MTVNSKMNNSSVGYGKTVLELGIKEEGRYLDMAKISSVPLYFSDYQEKRQLLWQEFSFSPYIWVSAPINTREDGRALGKLYIFTRSYKVELFLNQFSDGAFYFLVGGLFPKKQRDTINIIKKSIQVKHRFVLFCKGESSNSNPFSARLFYDEVGRIYEAIKGKEDNEPEEDIPNEDDSRVLDYCNTHIRLIDYEENYDKKKGYDFKYIDIAATENAENIKGVTYTFIVEESIEDVDKESLQGAEVIIRVNEEDDGIKGYVADLDTTRGAMDIKFPRSYSFYELPHQGLIKKSDKNVSYAIQRDAFKRLSEGEATNQSILDILLFKEFKPIREKEYIRIARLTPSQEKAVNLALSVDDFLLVQGPPGTGKTEIIVEMIQRFVSEGKRVLISSKNNLAVDNVLEKCMDRKIKCIRLGRPESVKIEKVKSILVDVYTLSIQKDIIESVKEEQNKINEERELNKDGLNHAYRLQDALKDYKSIRRKLLKSKIIFFFIKLLALVRLIDRNSGRYIRHMSQVFDLSGKKDEIVAQIDQLITQLAWDPQKVWQKTKNNYVSDMTQALLRRVEDAPKKLEISDKWLDELAMRQDVLTEVVREGVNVIGATCIGVNTNRLFNDIEYDVAIIDEAGQITLHDVIVPISKAKKVIVIGDHMQLPPVTEDDFIKEAREEFKDLELDFYETYKQSLFEKLFYEADEEHKIMLDTQFRMHEDIAKPISDLFYDGLYKTGCKREHRLINISGFDQPIVFIDTLNLDNKFEKAEIVENNGRQVAYTNPTEADILANILLRIIEPLQDGFPVMDYKGEKLIGLTDVGIITPYKAQIKCIKQAVHSVLKERGNYDNARIKSIIDQIEIDSVDSFQGRDKEIILYSFVRSNPECRVGFLDELRRLNVTITRAKRLLIMVGDSLTLCNCTSRTMLKQKNPKYYFNSLIDYLREKGYYRIANKEIFI